MTDFPNSIPNSPFYINYDGVPGNENEHFDPMQNYQQEPFNQNDQFDYFTNFADTEILDGRSNDFDSSVGGALAAQKLAAQIPQNMVPNPIFQKPPTQQHAPQAALIALSPNPVLQSPQALPKSTDFVLEQQVFTVKTGKKNKIAAPILGSPEDEQFYALCTNPDVKFNPKQLNFIPTAFWPNDQDYSFGDIVESFFRLKNNSNARFPHKLYNALILTSTFPELIPFIGLTWLTSDVIRVDTIPFARFLNIKSINGSLFHAQGNFPTHGFVEIKSIQDALKRGIEQTQLQTIDFDKVRILYHAENLFTTASTEEDIAKIKWISKKDRV